MADSIDRTSPEPYYEQLFHVLQGKIIAGSIAADEKLPSELELCRDYGLSRATVRQTMSKLESEGFARRVPRRGVFATTPDASTGWTVEEGFLESQIRHGGTDVTTLVLAGGSVVPPEHVAESLQLRKGEEAFALERVRSIQGRPAMVSTNWFPPDVGRLVSTFEDVLEGSASVNDRLRGAGFVAHGAHRVIRALAAPSETARHLGIEAGSPLLRVRSLTWNTTGTRFDYYETWVLTDVIPLEVNVSAA